MIRNNPINKGKPQSQREGWELLVKMDLSFLLTIIQTFSPRRLLAPASFSSAHKGSSYGMCQICYSITKHLWMVIYREIITLI